MVTKGVWIIEGLLYCFCVYVQNLKEAGSNSGFFVLDNACGCINVVIHMSRHTQVHDGSDMPALLCMYMCTCRWPRIIEFQSACKVQG